MSVPVAVLRSLSHGAFVDLSSCWTPGSAERCSRVTRRYATPWAQPSTAAAYTSDGTCTSTADSMRRAVAAREPQYTCQVRGSVVCCTLWAVGCGTATGICRWSLEGLSYTGVPLLDQRRNRDTWIDLLRSGTPGTPRSRTNSCPPHTGLRDTTLTCAPSSSRSGAIRSHGAD